MFDLFIKFGGQFELGIDWRNDDFLLILIFGSCLDWNVLIVGIDGSVEIFFGFVGSVGLDFFKLELLGDGDLLIIFLEFGDFGVELVIEELELEHHLLGDGDFFPTQCQGLQLRFLDLLLVGDEKVILLASLHLHDSEEFILKSHES